MKGKSTQLLFLILALHPAPVDYGECLTVEMYIFFYLFPAGLHILFFRNSTVLLKIHLKEHFLLYIYSPFVHLFMDNWNLQKQVQRRLSHIQTGLGRPMPSRLALGLK